MCHFLVTWMFKSVNLLAYMKRNGNLLLKGDSLETETGAVQQTDKKGYTKGKHANM